MNGDADFFTVVHRQRACRAFTDEPVDRDTIGRLLDAATFAPSAENGQPWRFVVVTDPGVRARLGELTRRAWEGGARDYEQGRVPDGLLADVDAGAMGGVAAAPVLIVVAADLDAVPEPAVPSSIWPAVQNLLLAATALGLGSALTTLATFFADEVRELVELSTDAVPVAIIPVGHPARPLGPPRREPWTTRTRWIS